MVSSLGAWGVPDFGNALHRERVSATIGRFGTRPAVLFGSSGCGKSVAAAHFASTTGKRAIWIDASGEFPTSDRMVHLVARAIGVESAQSDGSRPETISLVNLIDSTLFAVESVTDGMGVCVVVDDVGAPRDHADARGLARFARALRSCSSQMVVTARSTSGWPAEVLREWELVGAPELALTSEEAREVLACAGYAALAPAACELRDECAGHPAIFAVLASRAALIGVEAPGDRTESLDTWLDYLVFSQLPSERQDALVCASLLKSGGEVDLAALGVRHPGVTISALAAAIPLFASSQSTSGERTFRTHDLLDGFLLDRLGAGVLATSAGVPEAAARVLTARGDLVRATELLLRHADSRATAEWLECNGRTALNGGLYRQLFALIDATPVHELMARPNVLMLWAELCCEVGDLDEALAKCQAVRSLAEHSGDLDTKTRVIALAMHCLCRRHAFDEAERLSREVLSTPPSQSTQSLRGEAFLCLARARLLRGDEAGDTVQILAEASHLLSDLPSNPDARSKMVFISALVPIQAHGDWMSAIRMLSASLASPEQLVSSRIMTLGNLGIPLLEVGRLDRGRSVLKAAIAEAERFGLDAYVGAYSPVLGCVLVAAGEVEEGVVLLRNGVECSARIGDHIEAATDQVYLAAVLRASGLLDASLTEAEGAFERLSVADNMGFRRLAALEVAASLLALGDSSAARAWTHSLGSEGPNINDYHRLRAEMILAEADRRDGNIDEAVDRLAAYSDYIRSENGNWQMAMYCRAFPELLGILAIAVGPDNLPTHMLRMILPENAEVALGRIKGLVDEETWRALGIRLLGKEEFDKFVERDGMPLCHVRLFGGLEVNIGSRSVRERDWRKRKARLLFAMLALRWGQDVPREQVFEHLWPEMDESRAKSNLYVIWSAMKSVLVGEDAEKGVKCPYVESLGGVCRSVRDTVRTDVGTFESACALARDAEANGRTSDAMKAYRQMAEVYRGDLLPGDCYDDWFANLREHYRAEFMDAMLRAAEHLLEAGDPHTALMFVRRAIQHDEFREDLYHAALRCQIAAGQRSSAIETYMQCRDKLCDELGLDPSAEMRALYGEILAMEDGVDPVAFDPLAD